MSQVSWQFAGLNPAALQTLKPSRTGAASTASGAANTASGAASTAAGQPAQCGSSTHAVHSTPATHADRYNPAVGAANSAGAGTAVGSSGRKMGRKNSVLPAFSTVASGIQLPKGAEKVSSAPGFGGYAPSVFKTGMDYFAKYKHRLNETAVRNLTDNDQVFVGLLYARAEEKMGPSGDPEVSQDLRKVDKIAYQLVIHNMSHDISEELKEQEEARKARAASDEQLSEADPANRYRSPEKRARVETLAKARQERETERQNAHLSAPNPPRSDGLQQKTRDTPQDQANPDQREK